MQLRNHFVGLTLSAVCALGPLGCGDDTSGTGGGSTSSTTSSTTTTTTTTTSGTGGAGGEGGGGAQGGGGAGMGGMGGMGGMAQGGGGAGMGGMGGMNMGGGGAGGGTTMTPSQQIAAVLGTADGTGLNLVVADAIVTKIKPALGTDPAGFFVQAEQMGPALFVAVDPATLTPAPVVGDEVMFTVTEKDTLSGLEHAAAITNFMRHSQNNAVAGLVTDITGATDVVTALDAYTSRAVSLIADIDADFTGAGSMHSAAAISTSGLVGNADFRLRMPEALRATYDLQAGCTVILDYGAMWRFNGVAQASAFTTNDIGMADVDCLPPTVEMAQAASSTSVVITFDRLLDPASVQASDFTFTGGLMASAVMVNGNTVTVTTSAQTSGTRYTVTVAGVTDVLGEVVDPAVDEAMFTGFVVQAGLLINEVKPNITSGRDLVELLVTGAGTVNGMKLIQDGGSDTVLATLPDVSVAMGDIIVIHLVPTDTDDAPGSETTAKNQYASATYGANFDGAWDFHGGNTGLTYSNRVLRVDTAANIVLDAVPVVLTGQTTGNFLGDLQALQAMALWLPVDCGGMPCTYMTTPTAVDISVNYENCGPASEAATGFSIARKPSMNTKQKSDWNACAANSFGLVNP